MIIYLSDCDVIHNMDQYPDTIPNDADQQIMPHLVKEKWVIVLPAEYPHTEQHPLTNLHVDAKIITCIRLHDDEGTWMVPLIILVGPCCVVYNKDYTNTTNDNMHTDDRTAYIVELIAKWGYLFLIIHDA